MENSLSNKRPELVSEWSPRNGALTPDDISYGSNKLFWWTGKCGHEWQASAKSRSSGEKCPICSGARVIEGINDLQTLRPEIAEEWSPRNEPLKPTKVSVASHKKVIWRCKLGHEWTATIKSRTLNGTGCPYCSHNIVLPGFNDLASQFPEVTAEWSERNYPLLPNMVTAFTNKKVWWRCSKGHEWNTLVSTRAYGSKCPYCSGIKILEGFNDFATMHPELADEWSERNLPLSPDTVNERSQRNVWWKCKTCGFEWKSLVKSRVKGTVCPVCADRAVKPGYNDLSTTDPDLSQEWDSEKNGGLSPASLSRNSLRSVWWKCPHGHSWKAKIRDRAVDGQDCRYCEAEFHETVPQLLVMLYASRKNVRVTTNTETVLGVPLELYIPELGIAIDYQSSRYQRTQDTGIVKEYMCGKRGVEYVRVPHRKGCSEVEYARKIKAAFQTVHVYLPSDEEDDIDLIHRKFREWRLKKLQSIENSADL